MKLRFSKMIVYGTVLAGTLCFAGNSFADTIQGSVWAGATQYPSTGFTVPSTTPTATFTLSNPNTPFLFNFYSSTDANLTGFLTNNNTNGNIVNYTSGSNQTSSVPCNTGTRTNCGINNDVMQFTGRAYLQNGYGYHITHDDGMNLYIGSDEVITSGAPTAADTSSFQWTGSTGEQNFTLDYAEVNGAPAVLSSPDFGLTPEPSSLLLMGTGLAGLAFLVFRKREEPTATFTAAS